MSDLVRLINPANEEIMGEFHFAPASETERRIALAYQSAAKWRKTDLNRRLAWASELAKAMVAEKEVLATAITLEMGKPIAEAQSEVAKCIATVQKLDVLYPEWLSIYAQKVEGFDLTVNPLGVILGIMPWNFPLWQVIRFAVPTILGGNVVLLKHAPNVWGLAHRIEALFRKTSDLALYQGMFIDLAPVADVIGDSRVRGVSLTGSKRAGQSVAELAGRHLKKCVLELGGSDAYLVLKDADVGMAAETCVRARLLNCGQSCISPKRLIVDKSVVNEFRGAVLNEMRKYETGNPIEKSARMGPMARSDLRVQLHSQVQRSVKAGAKLETGGNLNGDKGFFYPPTLLTQVRAGQSAFDEELFGPVVTVIEAENEEQMIELANGSPYGLGGAVFSKDVERAYKIAEIEMDAGMVAINDFLRSDVHMNFGGVKDSGFGRELGPQGSFEFINLKAIQAPYRSTTSSES